MRVASVAASLQRHGGFASGIISFEKPCDVTTLSAVLETGPVPLRYYLSPKACAGILRRAEKRGRALPEALERALMAVAGGSVPTKRRRVTRSPLTFRTPASAGMSPGPWTAHDRGGGAGRR